MADTAQPDQGNDTTAATEQQEPLTREEALRLFKAEFNSAFTAREKREEGKRAKELDELKKLISERLPAPPAKPDDDDQPPPAAARAKPGKDVSATPPPNLAPELQETWQEMQAQLAELRKKQETSDRRLREEREARQKAEAERRNTERRAIMDGHRSVIAAELEKRGVRKAHARALMLGWEADGVLAFSEEDAAPRFKVKRARDRGSAAEELEYDDIVAGISDWSLTEGAKEWVSAQATPAKRPSPSAPRPLVPTQQTTITTPNGQTQTRPQHSMAELIEFRPNEE